MIFLHQETRSNCIDNEKETTSDDDFAMSSNSYHDENDDVESSIFRNCSKIDEAVSDQMINDLKADSHLT